MVFTIEPMLVEGDGDCVEWQSDGWTVVTRDGGRAAQFEHMVCITEDGVEILTLP
jgi:methionyl aminopeptidase